MKLPWAKKNNEQPQRRRANRLEHTSSRSQQGEHREQQLFRRNRTLVGSLSSRVSSASELTGDLRSPRTHVHHLTAHRRKLTTVFVAVVAASCFLTWLLYEFTATIHVSTVHGSNIVIDETRYQKAIGDYLASHPLERLRFMLNEDELTKYVVGVVPEVANVRTGGATGFATSQFDLTLRKPVAGWLIGSQQYYVDENGLPFLVNHFEQPQVKIIDKSGVPQTTGTTVASGRFLRFVGRTVTVAKAYGLTISQAIIPANTTHQVQVMVAKRNYPIKMSLDRPVGEQVEDMRNALRYFDKQPRKPKYVDIRVSGKAYYK